MDYKLILETLGYIEGVDFELTEGSFNMLSKTVNVTNIIYHEAVPAVEATYDEEGNELTPYVPEVPAYEEEVVTQETVEVAPPSPELIQETWDNIRIGDLAITDLILAYLSDKQELKTENDKMAIGKNRIISWLFENIPQPTVTELADLAQTFRETRETQARIKRLLEKGRVTDDACNTAFQLIQGYNVDRELTSAQKTEMESLFAPALQIIAAKRPGMLKAYISSIVPDGVLVTEQMKSDVLEVLKDF